MSEQQVGNTLSVNAKPEEKITIKVDDEHELTFRLIKWSPSKIFKRLPEYGKLLAAPMSMYPKEEERGYADYEQKIAMALFQFFGGLEDKDLDTLVREILDEVYVNGQQINVSEHMDTLFIKCPEILIDLCAKVLDINYSPFLKRGFNGLLTQLKSMEALSRN